MDLIGKAIDRAMQGWREPAPVIENGQKSEWVFQCRFNPGISSEAFSQFDLDLPDAYKEFLMQANGGLLFYDVTYGQWGMEQYKLDEIMDKTSNYAEMRGSDYKENDLIIGEFKGDSDLVLLRSDPNNADYGEIVISLPIDYRKDWYFTGKSFDIFISEYVEKQGAKFWER